jgi:5-formyltetrahydrofolate cyclo-ligase
LIRSQQPPFSDPTFLLETLNSILQTNDSLISYRGIHPELDPYSWENSLTTKNIFYPKVEGSDLKFIQPQGWTKSKWGFDPVGNHEIPLEKADWVIVPALGWNAKGYRLGRGGGFYDRKLQGFPRERIIGLTRSFEFPVEFPEDSWDLRAGRILSEVSLYSFL